MPLNIRLQNSVSILVKVLTAEVRLHEIAIVEGDVVDLNTLKQAGVITRTCAKVVLSGKIERAVTVRGLTATKRRSCCEEPCRRQNRGIISTWLRNQD